MTEMETHDIDVEPFVIAIQGAMEELLSTKEFDICEYDIGIAIIAQGLIYSLTGEEDPRITDQEIHKLGKCQDLLEDCLFDDFMGFNYEIPSIMIRSDPVWIVVVDRVVKAFASAYNEMFPAAEVV